MPPPQLLPASPLTAAVRAISTPAADAIERNVRTLLKKLRAYRSGRSLIGALQIMIDTFKSPKLSLLFLFLLAARFGRVHNACPSTFVFHPRVPNHRYMIWKVLRYMKASIASHYDANGAHTRSNAVYILWFDGTFVNPDVVAALPSHKQTVTFNIRLLDISKTHVDSVFNEVFGYGLMLDPTRHNGPCVEKSDQNGRHDGRVVECPITGASRGKVYQKLIDNRVEGGIVMDIRVPIIAGEIPFAYLKFRDTAVRFSNDNLKVVIKKVIDVLSTDEISAVKSFCQRIGLDVGELDLIRDNESSRIYIVDVNSTPYGPPNHLEFRESMRAVRQYSLMFRSRIVARSGGD